MSNIFWKIFLILMPVILLFALLISAKDIDNFNIVNHFRYLKTIDFGNPLTDVKDSIGNFNSALDDLEFAKLNQINSLKTFFSVLGNWFKNFGKFLSSIVSSSISLLKVVFNTVIQVFKHAGELYEWLTLEYLQ